MRLLFIRHGDPDYVLDGLTPTGQLEAELLSERSAGLRKATINADQKNSKPDKGINETDYNSDNLAFVIFKSRS